MVAIPGASTRRQQRDYHQCFAERRDRVFAYPRWKLTSRGIFNGTIYVAYTDRAADGELDFYLRKSTDQAVTWSSTTRINDDRSGNSIDQFHPRIP